MLLHLVYDGDGLKRATFIPSFVNDAFQMHATDESISLNGNWQIPDAFGAYATISFDGNADFGIDNERYMVSTRVQVAKQSMRYADRHNVVAELADKESGNSVKIWLDENGEWQLSRSREEITRDKFGNWVEKRIYDSEGTVQRVQYREFEYYGHE